MTLAEVKKANIYVIPRGVSLSKEIEKTCRCQSSKSRESPINNSGDMKRETHRKIGIAYLQIVRN